MAAFAVSSMFFHEYTTAEIFRFVRQSGLDGIEFWLETPHFWLRGLPVEDVITCRKADPAISLNIHAPILDLNPCSINPEVAAVSIRYAVQAVAIAEKLEAPVLTLHPGRRTAKRPPGAADQARFSRYLAAVREAAAGKSVRIAMENMEPAVNSFLSTPERMRQLLDEEPWLSFTLDTSHALAASATEPGRFIRLCGDRLANVHISRKEGKRLHLPLENSAGMAGIMADLKNAGYQGSLTLEIDDLNFDRPLSPDEKIAVLSRDCRFMHECMD